MKRVLFSLLLLAGCSKGVAGGSHAALSGSWQSVCINKEAVMRANEQFVAKVNANSLDSNISKSNRITLVIADGMIKQTIVAYVDDGCQEANMEMRMDYAYEIAGTPKTINGPNGFAMNNVVPARTAFTRMSMKPLTDAMVDYLNTNANVNNAHHFTKNEEELMGSFSATLNPNAPANAGFVLEGDRLVYASKIDGSDLKLKDGVDPASAKLPDEVYYHRM